MRNGRNNYPMGLNTPLGGESKRKTVEMKYPAGLGTREALGKHCKVAACLPRSLVLGRAREWMLLFSSSANRPLCRGVWAATTTMQLVRRMEWRPPLLYAYPLGHCVLDNLKITEIFQDYDGKNARDARISPIARLGLSPYTPLAALMLVRHVCQAEIQQLQQQLREQEDRMRDLEYALKDRGATVP